MSENVRRFTFADEVKDLMERIADQEANGGEITVKKNGRNLDINGTYTRQIDFVDVQGNLTNAGLGAAFDDNSLSFKKTLPDSDKTVAYLQSA